MTNGDPSIAERLDRLEQQVALLTRHLGLDADDLASDIPDEVTELARAGRQMEAIRRYTQITGTDISTATSVVNAIV